MPEKTSEPVNDDPRIDAPAAPLEAQRPAVLILGAKQIRNHPRTNRLADTFAERGYDVFVLGYGPQATSLQSPSGAKMFLVPPSPARRRFIAALTLPAKGAIALYCRFLKFLLG